MEMQSIVWTRALHIFFRLQFLNVANLAQSVTYSRTQLRYCRYMNIVMF